MIVINKSTSLTVSSPVTYENVQPRTQESCTDGVSFFCEGMNDCPFKVRVGHKRDGIETLVGKEEYLG